MLAELRPPHMSTKNKVINSLQSFVILPILATNLLVAPIDTNKFPTVAVLANEQNGHLFLSDSDNKQNELKEKAQKIDAYFSDKNLPLAGHGMKLVLEAEKNGLDFALLPAIAMRESTGYKFACGNNGFGWGSCRIKFDSIDEAIETVARNLGGNNPKTARYYANKDIDGILKTYNPPSIVAKYSEQVQSIMKNIKNYPIK
jgi:hypothetical protein